MSDPRAIHGAVREVDGVHRWDGAGLAAGHDALVAEEPLEIRVRGRGIGVTMRTPGDEHEDEELTLGFLLTEGVIKSAADVLSIEHCARNEMGNVLNVLLAPLVHVNFDRLTRHVFAASSCGLCGKATIDQVKSIHPPVISTARVRADQLGPMVERMRSAQRGFDQTGGVHAAALFEATGDMLVVREDVGRHNAVDKVIGWALRAGRTPLSNHILIVSGRTSFEIVQKAAAAGIGIIAGVSAPTSLAVDFAREMNQTLIGFVRERRLNVYSGVERVQA